MAGRPRIPETKKLEQLNVRVSPEVLRDLNFLCFHSGQARRDVIATLVIQSVKSMREQLQQKQQEVEA